MHEPQSIRVSGAREHNLKGIALEVPKKKLVVFTGPSGSGKSSLAIDTIYAEGRRRFVESLSAYARQFLGQKEKPKFDQIHGLSPCIAVEQKSASTNPRSTVGTITEIADYLRVLFARLGVQHCPRCGARVERQSAQQVVEQVAALPEGTKVILLAPRVIGRKGEHKDVLDELKKSGLVRVRIDGEVVSLDDKAKTALDKKVKHTIEAVVDRIVVREGLGARLADSVETGLKLGSGRLTLSFPDSKEPDRLLSERLACEACELSFPDLTPQSFSFNSPLGMCAACNGLGRTREVDESLAVADPELSVRGGALAVSQEGAAALTFKILEGVAASRGIDLDKPWKDLERAHRDAFLLGTGEDPIEVKLGKDAKPTRLKWEGLLAALKRKAKEEESDTETTLVERPCTECKGGRLRLESRHVKVAGTTLVELQALAVRESARWIDALPERLPAVQRTIAKELLKEIRARLRFLENVGLDYLSLERLGPSLSGGESQRIQLASQLGSELSGVIYVLDEPSIGLHARDSEKLIATLESLRDLGNSVIVVEHDREMIERADYLVDFGPGAGREGGEVVSHGTPREVEKDPRSLTGQYLSGTKRIALPAARRPIDPKKRLVVKDARANNLRGIDVAFPLGVFVCVTGVSGAGKSSLVNQILLPALDRKLLGRTGGPVPGDHGAITGVEHLDKVISIDQQPIGRTPRSNPATYVKVFDQIRELFAALPEAKAFGFGPGRFSPNVKGGRCEGCEGAGVKKIEMHFLADVWVTCEECAGRRFNDATLRVTYRGKSIADVLDLSVREALELFRNAHHIARFLETLDQVGLGYVALGQTSPTLSGGEAQRVKLAKELGRVATGRTLYVLDEPSTGLHFDDIRKLLEVLDRLIEKGNTVVVIEHNLDIVKTADWIVDLGPEGGAGGGELIAEGTPEDVARVERSLTGRFLAKLLERESPPVVTAGSSRKRRS